MGVHESQSRIYENQLGRRRAFTGWLYGRMRATFGDFGIADAEAFYATVNRVRPGFIRTEADEVQYNLHVLMRFDLERALIAGDLAVADLEAAWNDRFEADFGVTVDKPSNGVLAGCALVGGAVRLFPDLYARQCLCGLPARGAARGDCRTLDTDLARGDTSAATAGCARTCNATAALRTPRETIARATGLSAHGGPLAGLPRGQVRRALRGLAPLCGVWVRLVGSAKEKRDLRPRLCCNTLRSVRQPCAARRPWPLVSAGPAGCPSPGRTIRTARRRGRDDMPRPCCKVSTRSRAQSIPPPSAQLRSMRSRR